MSETRTIRVEVTAEDIATGVPMDGERCPIAYALLRSLNDACYYAVDCEKVELDGEYDLPLPKTAQDFILAFDDAQDVSPFAFDLSVPVEVLRG